MPDATYTFLQCIRLVQYKFKRAAKRLINTMDRRFDGRADLILEIKSIRFILRKCLGKCINLFFKGVGIVFIRHSASIISAVMDSIDSA